MTPAVKGGQPSLARVEEGAVRLLNADGDAVEGPMADLYVLKRISDINPKVYGTPPRGRVDS